MGFRQDEPEHLAKRPACRNMPFPNLNVFQEVLLRLWCIRSGHTHWSFCRKMLSLSCKPNANFLSSITLPFLCRFHRLIMANRAPYSGISHMSMAMQMTDKPYFLLSLHLFINSIRVRSEQFDNTQPAIFRNRAHYN